MANHSVELLTHHNGKNFYNPYPGFQNRGFRDFLKWQRDRRNGKAPVKPGHYDFKIAPNDGQLLRENRAQFTVTWIGHATTLIQLAGKNILTDPVFSTRCSPVSWLGPLRATPPVPAFEYLPSIDLVLLSHDHYDHLDAATIKRLGNRPQYFAPLGVGKILQGWGIAQERIIELDWWQDREWNGVQLHCTPAQHFSGRGLHNRNGTLWCGWVIVNQRQHVYFGGDSGYFPGFQAIGEKFGGFDLAILPIGAYSPRWFMSGVHMDPRQTAQAFLEVHAEKMLAIHWGTFDLADEPLDEPPQLLRAAADTLGIAPGRVWIFQPGETRVVA